MLPAPDNKKTSFCFHHTLAIIIIIPFLFLLAVIVAYLGLIEVKVEFHTLLIVAFIFLVFLFFVKHNANYAVCHMRGSFKRMEEELQQALRENVLVIGDKKRSTLNVKTFINDYYRGIRDDNFARVASSVFPMLGILGTFTAIAISMPDFTAQDSASLDKEISTLLSGIGTAFYASIYGILLSLIWTYFEKRGSGKADKKVLELERLYSSHVWKESELIRHRHMMSELKDQEIVQTLKETFNLDFIKELNEQYQRSFTNILTETNSNFQTLTSHMKDASGELGKTLEKINSSQSSIQSLEALKANMDQFNQSAIQLHNALKSFDSSVGRTFEGIDTEVAQVVNKLSSFANIIAEQNDLIAHNIATLKKGS